MPLNITITDAGRAEIINAQNTGTAPVLIAEVALGTGQYTPTSDQTTLQAEHTRLNTISGEVVAVDTVSLTIKDESNDAYDVGEIGMFTDSGTLFAVYSQPSASGVIVQKAAESILLLTTDIILVSINAAALTFGDVTFSNPPATETQKGVVELADETEALTGDDLIRAMPARRVHQAFQQFGIGTLTPGLLLDINSITLKAGAYKVDDSTAGIFPAGVVAKHGQVLIHRHNASSFCQFYIRNATTDDRMFFRIYNGGFSTWRELTHTGNFDASEYLKTADANANVVGLGNVRNVASYSIAEVDQLLSDATAIPAGIISMWSGAIVNIPEGWALCDGLNGTPNLRDRFVVGAGGSLDEGATGGSADAVVVSHNHSGSADSAGNHGHSGSANSAGAHTHTKTYNNSSSGSSHVQTSGSGSQGTITSANSAGAHTHSLSINSNGAHTHSLSINSTGESGAGKNLPPYYALAFIMKL